MTGAALAGGSIGAALAAGDEAGKAYRAAGQLLEAVMAGSADRCERALRQAPYSARGEFTAMLDALAETLGEAARGGLGQAARRPVPAALERVRARGAAPGHGARRRGPRGGLRQREPADPARRIGRGAGGGPVKLSHLDEARPGAHGGCGRQARVRAHGDRGRDGQDVARGLRAGGGPRAWPRATCWRWPKWPG